jgi:hypothetical protein
MEGRAYDQEGVYMIAGAGNAKILDFIHQQKKNGRSMGVSCNLAGNRVLYFVAMRTDNSLTDWAFSEAVNNANAEEVQRFLLGARPHNWCVLIDKENYGSSLPWQEYSPEKIMDVYNNIRDNLILYCYRFGYFPHDALAWGNVKIMKTMPILQRIICAGYQVVPAVKLNEKLWQARYGHGINTYLFTGNQKFKAQELTAIVDNKYLGKGDYIFCHDDGRSVPNLIENQTTSIKYSIKPKEAFILKAALRISEHGAARLKGEATEAGDATPDD